jgi:diadenosine tetraphosphatase ApaH/serine/threonine PP2A family protein phosphatase
MSEKEKRMICFDLMFVLLDVRYGFMSECVQKYGDSTAWNLLNDVFDFLPLGALIDDKIFCVHGGLSPHCASLNQIRILLRGQDVPLEGLVAGTIRLHLNVRLLVFSAILFCLYYFSLSLSLSRLYTHTIEFLNV